MRGEAAKMAVSGEVAVSEQGSRFFDVAPTRLDKYGGTDETITKTS